MKNRILILDADETTRLSLKARFEREGLSADIASNAKDVQSRLNAAKFQARPFAVLFMDSQSTEADSHSLLKWVNEFHSLTSVVVTGTSKEKDALIQLFREGVSDFFEKPLKLDAVMLSTERLVNKFEKDHINFNKISRLESRLSWSEGHPIEQVAFVSDGKAMASVDESLNHLRKESMRVESQESTVLLLGEIGTGKRLFSRLVHSRSRRAKGPWIAINCAELSPQHLEAELLGYEAGAIKGNPESKLGLFDAAHGGTLFLAKIGTLELPLQAKLLKIFQEKTFRPLGSSQDHVLDIRVIVTSELDLQSHVEQQLFNKELYQWISQTVIRLPSLRARREDILPLAKQFAKKSFQALGKTFSGFTEDVDHTLLNYTWPGNVKELLIVVERLALTWSGQGRVDVRGLGLNSASETEHGGRVKLQPVPLIQDNENSELSYTELKKKWSDSFEREYLVMTLNRNDGNVSAAARDAKLDRSNFLRLLRKHGVRAQEFRKAA